VHIKWGHPCCGAWSRRAQGPCRQPAMANGRCAFHGGKNPGAPIDNTNAMVQGRWSREEEVARKAGARESRSRRDGERCPRSG
jgi:hypothetical protein